MIIDKYIVGLNYFHTICYADFNLLTYMKNYFDTRLFKPIRPSLPKLSFLLWLLCSQSRISNPSAWFLSMVFENSVGWCQCSVPVFFELSSVLLFEFWYYIGPCSQFSCSSVTHLVCLFKITFKYALLPNYLAQCILLWLHFDHHHEVSPLYNLSCNTCICCNK